MDGDIRLSNQAEELSENHGEAASAPTQVLDDVIMSLLARQSGGLSSMALMTAFYDWSIHMAASPGRQMELLSEASARAFRRTTRNMFYPFLNSPDHEDDERSGFNPYSMLAGYFEDAEQILDKAVHAPRGVSEKNRKRVRFAAHQALELFHPDNFLFSNREAMVRTIEERGANLQRGFVNFLRDYLEEVGIGASEPNHAGDFAVGENLAVTPGSVVYRNDLIELIQYAPQTDEVFAPPILITPAWIMKYYILDLSAQKSLVRYLASRGHTVFMISWRNPNGDDAELSFDDYRRLGVMSAMDAISALIPGQPIHGAGYCLGGTLMAVAAAAMARDGDDRLASLSLLAAQTDFRDPGELSIFIDEDQLDWLDASMKSKGYLSADQMAGAFQMLRARDLVWRRFQRSYLYGEKDEIFDLLAWNKDTTRMPYKMHSEYLRKLFLHNDFVQGRLMVENKPVAISDIRASIFALGAERDHVAPWRSVYKINLFADVDATFALTNGGHNAGVVTPPGHPSRRHRIHSKKDRDHYIAPDEWLQTAEERQGSWWVSWADWLERMSEDKAKARLPARASAAGNVLTEGSELPAAPGSYVLES